MASFEMDLKFDEEQMATIMRAIEAQPLLGRLGRVVKSTVPAHIGVTYSVKLSCGLKMQEMLIAEPDGGNLDALTDQTIEAAIRENLAHLPSEAPHAT